MSKIQEKITVFMDKLQNMMENDIHLTDFPAVVTVHMQASLYRSHMNDEDKDYYDAVQWWLEEYPEKSWNVQ